VAGSSGAAHEPQNRLVSRFSNEQARQVVIFT
jgi:hypothetical protein